MRWNQKGMIACLILFVAVLGLMAIQSVKQKDRVSEPNYASEEDIVSLSDELKGKNETVTGGAVTKTATKLHTAGTKKDTAGKKKESEKQSPQATAAVTAGPDQRTQKGTSIRQEKSEKKQEKTTTDKKTGKKKTDPYKKRNLPEMTAAPVSGTGTKKPSQPTVHFEIQCKSILDKQELWREGIEEIVPRTGIFYSGVCSFNEGETVHDLLKRVCQEQKIALDCNYTPIYGSYYVRGIGNLYEFDCGSESGWKYMVNGVMPGVSASRYTVQNQDKIAYVYQYEL